MRMSKHAKEKLRRERPSRPWEGFRIGLFFAELLSQFIQKISEATELFVVSFIDHDPMLLRICKFRLIPGIIAHGSAACKDSGQKRFRRPHGERVVRKAVEGIGY